MEDIRRALGEIMQVGAQSEEKIVGHFDSALVRFAQPISPDQVRRGEGTFFEIRHPEQILVIAQTAASVFEIWFLHINAVAEFAVTRLLIAHSHLDIFALRAGDAFGAKLIAKLVRQGAISGQEPRFEHCRLREHVAIRLRQCLFYRTRGMTDFEADVPEQIQNLLRHLFHVRRDFARAVSVQQHDIDIAKRIQFASAVSAQCGQCQRGLWLPDCAGRGRKNMSQDYIDQFAAAGANFAAATAGLMFQAEPVLFQLEKLFVVRKDFGWPLFSGDRELVFSVGQDFLKMSRGRHCRS